MQISNLTGVALYQLGNPAFFVNTTVHSESFPTTGSFAAVSPSPGKGAGSESGRGGVSLAGRKWVRTGSGRGGDGWVRHPGAQTGLGMGSPGMGGEERAGLQRERLGGTMEPGASQAARGVVAPMWVALMLEGCSHYRVLGWSTEWVSPGKGLP